MSMPSFPKDGANITREQALTMIIASIAMEESALGRVIDAEGDKLRYILDRCRESSNCEKTLKEIMEVNASVTRLLDTAACNQAILRSKLDLALSAGGGCSPVPPCPPMPPCPPEPPGPLCPEQQKSLLQLRLSGDGLLWKPGCPIPWEYQCRRGDAACWSMENPALVRLGPGRAWYVSCAFLVRDFRPTAASGCISIEGAGLSRDLMPLCFSICCADGEAVTLPYTALLMPDSASAISFRLRSRHPIWVEQAELNLVEL